jgi:hypothetical protein
MKVFGTHFHVNHAIFEFRCNLEPDTAILLDCYSDSVIVRHNETTGLWIVAGVLPTKQYQDFKLKLDIAMLEYEQATNAMRIELMQTPDIFYTSSELKRMKPKRIRSLYKEPKFIPAYMNNIIDRCD